MCAWLWVVVVVVVCRFLQTVGGDFVNLGNFPVRGPHSCSAYSVSGSLLSAGSPVVLTVNGTNLVNGSSGDQVRFTTDADCSRGAQATAVQAVPAAPYVTSASIFGNNVVSAGLTVTFAYGGTYLACYTPVNGSCPIAVGPFVIGGPSNYTLSSPNVCTGNPVTLTYVGVACAFCGCRFVSGDLDLRSLRVVCLCLSQVPRHCASGERLDPSGDSAELHRGGTVGCPSAGVCGAVGVRPPAVDLQHDVSQWRELQRVLHSSYRRCVVCLCFCLFMHGWVGVRERRGSLCVV